jgi:hypothetical protein
MVKTDLSINPALEEDPVLAYIHNGNILDMIRRLDKDKRLFTNGDTLVLLFAKDGLTQLCQLYNKLLDPPAQEATFDSTLVSWQHESHLTTVASILVNLIEMPNFKDDAASV